MNDHLDDEAYLVQGEGRRVSKTLVIFGIVVCIVAISLLPNSRHKLLSSLSFTYGGIKGSSCQLVKTTSTKSPAALAGNITNNPVFVGSSTNNFRLASNSPCINKGANQYALTTTDYVGSHRIKDWRVDMGAYEVQTTRFVTVPNGVYPMGVKIGRLP